jgi:ATP-dependent DNA ligase
MTHPAPMRFKTAAHSDLPTFTCNDSLVFEPKLDGMRCVITVTADGAWAMASHVGEMKTSTAGPVAWAIASAFGEVNDTLLAAFETSTVYLDGEVMGDGNMWVFDLMLADEHLDLATRRQRLEATFPVLSSIHSSLRLVPQATTAASKAQLAKDIYDHNGEGIMIKNQHAPYDWGQRVGHSVKVKFVSDADVVVMATNVGASAKVKTGGKVTAKDNVAVGVFIDGVLTEIARCSTIGKPDMEVGDVVVVQYLYLGAGQRLCQPTVLRVRDDKAAEDCTDEQLRTVNKDVLYDITVGV